MIVGRVGCKQVPFLQFLHAEYVCRQHNTPPPDDPFFQIKSPKDKVFEGHFQDLSRAEHEYPEYELKANLEMMEQYEPVFTEPQPINAKFSLPTVPTQSEDDPKTADAK